MTGDKAAAAPLPLAGVRVLEFTQLIMGPVTGLILADLGADVIKIEAAPHGDPTRQLSGFASGFSDFFNRNKRSVAVDLKRPESRAVIDALCRDADVLIENFAPGTMDRLGYGYAALTQGHPRLVYCTLKGFLPGPYEQRTALDEAIQFMGGLAYMTGPPGRPLRAGTSVVDLMGGAMAAIAIMAALKERERSGVGQLVQTGLFESVAFLMGQHMAAVAVTGKDLAPMPAREGGWGVYDLFRTADGEDVFVAVTNDSLWQRFCAAFAFVELAADARLTTNAQRLEQRGWLIPHLGGQLAQLPTAAVTERLTRAGIPFGNVATSKSLGTDPHLVDSGALVDIVLRTGETAGLPRLPFRLGEQALGVRRQPPRVGQHTREVLAEAGLGHAQLDALLASGVVAAECPRGRHAARSCNSRR